MRNGHDIQVSIVQSSYGTTMPPAMMMRARRRPSGARAGTLISSALLVLSTGVACFDLHLLLRFATA